MCSQMINTIGLILDIIGAIVLFFYSRPQPSFEEGMGLGLEEATVLSDGRTVAEHNEEVRRIRDKHIRRSRIGMLILAIGFAFQLWATWL